MKPVRTGHGWALPARWPASTRARCSAGGQATGWHEAIADQFVLSLKTVRNYVSSIFSKLQVADRAQAIVRARDAGFGQREL